MRPEYMLSEALLEKYSKWSDFDVLENANKYPGPTGFFSMVAEKTLVSVVKEVLPADIYRAHEDGLIYVHKLPFSLYTPYCTGHSIARLLTKGLRTATVTSRPARHFDTMVDHVANYLITLQHYFTGAQAFSSVEWYAGPFIRADRLDYRAVKQNVQRLLFNLNYPTRIGLQTPFTNFTIVLDAPKKMVESEYAVYAGKHVAPLIDYESEAKLFVKALTDVLLEGDAHGTPFTFPIPTLMATAKSIWEEPELHEAVFKAASRRGSFYWLNTRVVDPEATISMCCRLTLQKSEVKYLNNNSKGFRLAKTDVEVLREEFIKGAERGKFGGVWSIPDVTGSINVTGVNLPRLASIAKGDDAKFWELYEAALTLVKLAEDWFRARYVKLMTTYRNMYSMIAEYLPEFPSSYFSTVGLVGLPEAVAILMQEPRLWTEGSRSDWLRAAELMKRMVEFAVEHAREWMGRDGVLWNVEEVPGESAAAKLASKDLKRFPELAEYLPDPSNPIYSTSVTPYYAEMELADRVEVEQRVQKHFTGGVMMHIFLGEEPDPEALASLTKKLINTDLVYWSYTPAITFCPICKKTYTGLYSYCPRCGSRDVDVWSRIVGYYRPLRNWNPHRKMEFWRRKHYEL